ncbi:MAG: GTPase ObgE [Chloroflexota bacterium]|nr:GTPase ObgE [Chloroflexota bacterium]
MLVDTARIHVKAGNGGNGSASFRREKYVPKGGPDGGDGGKGGDVVLRVVPNLNTLLPFQYVHLYKAENGGHGAGRNRTGRKGKDTVVKVPPGTVVFLDETGEQIADLTEPGEELVVARGGKGGLGNVHFKSATRQAPRVAELGEPGEERWLRLELRLIADVGLIGLPNAGKSTLLSTVTKAKPKIADYPFTTLQPNLGVVEIGGEGGQTFVLADIPGLIEGAAAGAGLGHEFLRHVRRTKVLIHVLDASGGLEERDPIEDFQTIMEEIETFDPEMGEKPMFVALNKIDLQESRDNVDRLRAWLTDQGYERIYEISAATGEGTDPLMQDVAAELREILEREAEQKRSAEEQPKRRVYTLGDVDERAWDVERLSKHHFRVSGVGIERFTRMTNFDVPDSVDRFQRVLEGSGIQAELERQGVQDGDIVHIADFEMPWGDQDEQGNLLSADQFVRAALEAEAEESRSVDDSDER